MPNHTLAKLLSCEPGKLPTKNVARLALDLKFAVVKADYWEEKKQQHKNPVPGEAIIYLSDSKR